MKKILTALAGVLLTLAVQAQGPVKQKAVPQSIKERDAAPEKPAKEAEVKQTDFDPATRAQLQQSQFLLYHFGAKPGC